jgi:phytanoyl-CoA hydroxylase
MEPNAPLMPRSTSLPEFTPEELQQFHQNGFAIVRDVADEPLRRRMADVTQEGLHRHIEPIEYEADLRYPGAPESHEALGGRTVRRLKQAHSRDHVFTEWVQHPAIVSRLRQILGPDLVCPLAHHNCIMTKEPRYSSDTGWHQDIRYWSFMKPELVSVWLALGPEREENGCLQLVPGSHRRQFPPHAFDGDLFFREDLAENQEILAERVLAELNPGDVLIFHCRTLHSATRNHTQETKYSVVMTYRSLDNPPLPGTRSAASPELLLH